MMSSNNDEEATLVDDIDPIDAYRQSLSELVLNSKPHIVMLTMLAEESKDNRAPEIVKCIEERLFQVNNEAKLPTLYLIDSICKNVSNSNYISLFQKRIIQMFCHTFEKADEKTRLLLYKLRQTWNTYFSPETLYQLDLAVKKIDSNWPVANRKIQTITQLPQNGQVQNINVEIERPGVIKSHQILTSPPKPKSIPCVKADEIKKTTESTGTTHPTIILVNKSDLVVKRNIIEKELRKELINKTHLFENNKQITKSNNTNHINKLPINEMEQQPSKNKRKLNETPPSKVGGSPTKLEKKVSNINKMLPVASSMSMPLDDIIRSPSKKNKTKISKHKQTASSNSLKQTSAAKQSKKNQDEVAVPIIAPDDVIPLGREHHVPVTKRSKEVRLQRNDAIKNIKKRRIANQRTSPTPNRGSSGQQNPIDNVKPTVQPSPVQTTIPGPNVFSQPEMYSPQTNSNQSAPSFYMDRDYRQELESLMNDAKNKLNAGTISSADHEILVREAHRQFFEHPAPMQQQPSQMIPLVQQTQQFFPSMNAQQMAQPQFNVAPAMASHQQTQQTSYLEPPYGSSALYINKQFCRLFYLDHITGIVLFKANPDTPFDHLVSVDPVYLEPKQIYFSGHPTTVIIDPGTPTELSFCLKFNDQVPFIFNFPGQHTPQRIMLGLPDRELIINDRPYKAQFGGAPISVYMECDGQNHLFMLSDSKPLLQVSKEPRFDLWNRIVAEAKAKVASTALPTTNVTFSYGTNTIPTMTMAVPGIAPSNNYVQSQQPPPTNVQCQVQPSTMPPPMPPNKPLPDLSQINSLLSQLTKAGLIGNKSAMSLSNSSSTEENSQQKQKPKPKEAPKQYLPLDMAKLKQNHQFVIDQLYIGLQCTNCSLRFPDESLNDDSGKKTRYARHLDWHFRQNRREKTKEARSAMTAHRRPWYYTIDQWILFKEVNDDIEEDNNAFFDSNSANSPNGNNKSNIFNVNFNQFKDAITEFELFIETISCDNNNSCGNSAASNKENVKDKICSVVAESDITSNCTVCNEPFDLRWFEDEEEWRLMNAVCYKSADAADGRNFHPLCLKDHLLQQLDQSHNLSINPSDAGAGRGSMIPGLDTPLKDDDDLKSKLESTEDDEMDEVKIKKKDLDDEEQLKENDNNEPIQEPLKNEDVEMENFEIEVEEFEIPIPTEQPTMAINLELKPNVDDNDSIVPTTTNDDPPKNQLQQQSTTKRGIVIRFGGAVVASNPISTTNPTMSSSNDGNVLASNVDDCSNHSRDSNSEVVAETSTTVGDNNSTTNVDDQQLSSVDNIKHANKVDDDDYNKINKDTNDELDDVKDNENKIEAIVGDPLVVKTDIDDHGSDSADEPHEHDVIDDHGQQSPGDSFDHTTDEGNVDTNQTEPEFSTEDDDVEEKSPSSKEETNEDDGEKQIDSGESCNYYSRGHEYSGLCSIM